MQIHWTLPLALGVLAVGLNPTFPSLATASDPAPAAADSHGAQAAAPAADAHGAPAAAPPATGEGASGVPLFELPKNWESKCPNNEPCPRKVPAPKINGESFDPLDDKTDATWNYQKYRYSVIMLISSWNSRSTELMRITRKYAAEFRRRNIGLLALASHDTRTELKNWQHATRAPFPVGLSKLAFTKAHANPKVPTVWIADGRGNLITMQEIPDNEEYTSMLNNVILWSEF